MAPFDAGVVMNMRLVDPLSDRAGPSPDDHAAIGEYLRALREHNGQTLGELAESTKIRRAYLQGIEEGDRSVLPARPFAIGYVRAYAEALGVDGDAAAVRFKTEWPDAAEPFRDPVGVAHERPKRSPLIFGLIGLVIAGVVGWNVVQRTMVQEDRDGASMPAAEPIAPTLQNTVVAIGAATPAPAAQNLPTPYQTPGLGAPAPQMKGGVPVMEPTATATTSPAADAPARFTTKAPVYGAPAGPNALVVLQARKPASLIVRGNGGAVYFARQLAAGESFRAPAGEALSAEVVDPAAFVLYVAGDNKGALVSQQTALDKLAIRPAPAAPIAAVHQAVAAPVLPAAQPLHAAVHSPAATHPHPAVTPVGGHDAEPQPRGEPPQGDVAYYPQRQN